MCRIVQGHAPQAAKEVVIHDFSPQTLQSVLCMYMPFNFNTLMINITLFINN